MTLSNDGKYLAVAAHNLVKVFDLRPEQFANEVLYEGHTGNITAIGFQADNKWFFTASEDGTLKIFDFKKSGFMRNHENNGVMVNAAVLHSNQADIIYGDQSGRVRIWDLTSNAVKDLDVLAGELPVRSMAISNNGVFLIVGNGEGTCFIWRSENGTSDNYIPMQQLEAHPDNYVLKCVFSQDSQFLATGSSDKTCKIFQLCEVELGPEEDEDESEEGVGKGNSANTKETETSLEFAPYAMLAGHGGWVWDCAFTDDNNFVITGSTDHKARVWKVEREEVRRVFTGHSKGITCLAFKDQKSAQAQGTGSVQQKQTK